MTPIDETMRALDDLVRTGKVRYIGFSDTPAWKCAQAQTMAQLRGWTPLIALQIEYSLLERTVEGELIPMARELGLGITPWSPLRGGLLSGKYTRDDPTGGDARRDWMKGKLDERALDVIDVLREVAAEASCTSAQAALAWCRQKEGVASTIIGARTTDQLRDNIASLGVTLTPAQMASLDDVSTPTLSFPHAFLQRIPMATQGGTTVNGRVAEAWPLGPEGDDDRW